ncbi:MAG: hypothetical protein ACLR71_11520 [[Clostridium] scindens]
MGNDIFADYIKNLKQNNESARPAVPYAVGRENVSAGGGSETLDVLKEISQKAYRHADRPGAADKRSGGSCGGGRHGRAAGSRRL